MNIAVIGSGYVGLVAGACFAENGNDVCCVDIDQRKIDMLNRGEIPIYEPGLKEIVENNIEHKRLTFTTDLKTSVQNSEIIFIAVGTPEDQDGSADLRYVLGVAESIGKAMNGYKIIVNKSTVPVGTADKVSQEIKKHTQFSFDVVSNPEFLKEGAAIEDFMKPDRVVIGASRPEAAERMRDLYAPFVRTGKPILVMDVRSAELTKYASNAMLATRVTFMNEIANLCEKVGADVDAVRRGVGTDSRIGSSFLFPGVGYGGSCFPKDVKALIKVGEENAIEMEIVNAVDQVNTAQKSRMSQKVAAHFGGATLKGKKFALWGLAFKPRTDDMREAPSITIAQELIKMGATVSVYDPEAMGVAKTLFDAIGLTVTFASDNYAALEGADALVVVTEWNEFRRPNFDKVKSLLKAPLIFDGRNIYEPAEMQKLGFTYYSMGRVPVGI
ncbi:UDP-glucose/GDP-mannose dehydrogenase family protein [bacterium]|nr:UDP-glucose/GDP-mannose dehydrogenase family protein [bacterium]